MKHLPVFLHTNVSCETLVCFSIFWLKPVFFVLYYICYTMVNFRHKKASGHLVAKIVAIVNQKGGVGKTTTCVNLTAALKLAGKRVLLCDFDPQANSTSGMGVDKSVSNGVYVYTHCRRR